jgi:hypothetical protein
MFDTLGGLVVPRFVVRLRTARIPLDAYVKAVGSPILGGTDLGLCAIDAGQSGVKDRQGVRRLGRSALCGPRSDRDDRLG